MGQSSEFIKLAPSGLLRRALESHPMRQPAEPDDRFMKLLARQF